MRKLLFLISIFTFVFITSGYGVDLGLTGGKITKTDGFNYGFSVVSGLFIPTIKLEVEYFKLLNDDIEDKPNFITAGIKLRPKLGKISPFITVGVGYAAERLNFRFSQWDTFTYLGGGIYLKLKSIISIRGDVRLLNFSDHTKIRFDIGLFLRI